MPNLFLEVEGEGAKRTDPAADIAAFLLSQPAGSLAGDAVPDADDTVLDELVKLYAGKVIGAGKGPRACWPKGQVPRADPAGDEVELVGEENDSRDEARLCRSPDRQPLRLLRLSRHSGVRDRPSHRHQARGLGSQGSDQAGPRAHRGVPAPPRRGRRVQTRERVDAEMQQARAHTLGTKKFGSRDEEEAATRGSFFYASLLHHGREGFLWQKLRAPRSYDYEKTRPRGTTSG
ncbi:MAG: hypothetical protein Ct9H300mP1_26950 [Planctomycetaceae bacterium]|nr:MAG: hypothetical protein Ct9H300mP1_26950 [Planctomycetaceae bacterium]